MQIQSTFEKQGGTYKFQIPAQPDTVSDIMCQAKLKLAMRNSANSSSFCHQTFDFAYKKHTGDMCPYCLVGTGNADQLTRQLDEKDREIEDLKRQLRQLSIDSQSLAPKRKADYHDLATIDQSTLDLHLPCKIRNGLPTKDSFSQNIF